jgi:hypothetical protein
VGDAAALRDLDRRVPVKGNHCEQRVDCKQKKSCSGVENCDLDANEGQELEDRLQDGQKRDDEEYSLCKEDGRRCRVKYAATGCEEWTSPSRKCNRRK